MSESSGVQRRAILLPGRGGQSAASEADELVEALFAPGGQTDPYPLYRRLRSISPLWRSERGWYASGYDECAAILREPRLGKWDPDQPASPSPSMLTANPPDHTRLRGVATRFFTPRALESIRAALTSRAETLVARIAQAREVDAMEALALPLTVDTIGELLGIPEPDRSALPQLNRDMTAVLEPGVTPEARARAASATAVVDDYYGHLFAERAARPTDDLLSAMVRARDAGLLSDVELLTNVKVLFGAGFETTAYLIGNGIMALIEHPDQLPRLRRDPSLIPSAVEEFLRYDSPVQTQGPRTALGNVALGSVEVAAGEQVFTLLGAANRDPARFEDPDRLDVARGNNHPLSFGGGIHFCLGAALARLEGQVAFAALVSGTESMGLAGVPQRRRGVHLRGFLVLPLRVEPALAGAIA